MGDSLKLKQIFLKDRSQYKVLIGLSLAVWVLAAIIYLSDTSLFQRFLGNVNPLVAFALTIILGGIALTFLLCRGWFAVYKGQNYKALLQASGLAALFGLLIILFDLKIVFPAETNVLFPQSLVFYPTIGFLAEMVFHVIPLALLLLLASLVFVKTSRKHLLWISIVVVSMLEPLYQSWPMYTSGRFPLWAAIYVGVHIFFISLCQLLLFKKYDFVTMYAFRFAYYLIWHVGWGYLRLKLLF